MRQIGCAELLNDLMRHIQDPTIQSEIQETMRALVNDAELTQLTQSQLMTSPIRLENESAIRANEPYVKVSADLDCHITNQLDTREGRGPLFRIGSVR